MAKTTVELPPALHRKLRVKAAVENCSMNDIVIAALQGYMDNFRLEPNMLEIESIPRSGQAGRSQPEEDLHAGRADRTQR